MLTDADVPAVTARLGLPGLIDVHVHVMPDRLQQAVWAYFDRAEEHYGVPWPVRYRTGVQERAATLAALGVQRYPGLLYPHKAGMAAALTDWALDYAAGRPAVIPSFTVFPEPGAPAMVEAAVRRGALLGKAHVQVGGYDPADPLLDGVWAVCAEAAVPVVIHAGHAPLPGVYTGLARLEPVLRRHPQLPLVLAHMGAPEFDLALLLAERHPQVRLDTTMAFTDFPAAAAAPGFPATLSPGQRASLADLGLAGKVLFGTDFPTIPYAYAHQLEALLGLDLGDAWLRQVCWGAAAALGLGPAAPAE